MTRCTLSASTASARRPMISLSVHASIGGWVVRYSVHLFEPLLHRRRSPRHSGRYEAIAEFSKRASTPECDASEREVAAIRARTRRVLASVHVPASHAPRTAIGAATSGSRVSGASRTSDCPTMTHRTISLPMIGRSSTRPNPRA
jgi:hypothetical protein